MADLAVVKNVLDTRSGDLARALPQSVAEGGHLLASIKANALLAVSQSPQLQRCSPASLYAAVLRAATLGLDLNPVRRLAYLVPYGADCQLQVGYRGLVALAKRAGAVRKIAARIVYDGDECHYSLGLHEDLVHVPCEPEARGQPRAAYAIAWTPDGDAVFEVMSWSEIMAIARKSKSGAWRDSPEEMARKTVLRRLLKYLPDSVEDIEAQMSYEDGEAQAIDGEVTAVVAEPVPRRPATATDRLKSALGLDVSADVGESEPEAADAEKTPPEGAEAEP